MVGGRVSQAQAKLGALGGPEGSASWGPPAACVRNRAGLPISAATLEVRCWLWAKMGTFLSCGAVHVAVSAGLLMNTKQLPEFYLRLA